MKSRLYYELLKLEETVIIEFFYIDHLENLNTVIEGKKGHLQDDDTTKLYIFKLFYQSKKL